MFEKIWKMMFPSYTLTTGKTVRYAFPLVVLTALFASLASVITENTSYISIHTSPSSVLEGENFYIEVRATAHTPVNAVDITIKYPESQMSIESVDTGTSVITLWTEKPYAKDGRIYMRGGTFRKGFIGEHTIARINAKALESGIAKVTTDNATFVAGDGLGTLVDVADVEDDETRIYITGVDGELIGTAEVAFVTDLDGNGEVDLKDISAFMAAWFTKGKIFDFNGDGRMTLKDFSILLADSFIK